MSDTFLKVIRDLLTFLRDPLWQFLLAGPLVIIVAMIQWKPGEKIQQRIKKVLLMGSGLFFAAVLILAILFPVLSPTKQGIGHLLSRMNDFDSAVTSLRWLDNTRLSASSKDGTTKKWDALTGENEVNISHPDSQNAADPSAQGIIEQNQSGDKYKEPMPSYDGKYIASVVADSLIITPNGPLSAHIVVKDKATGRVVITISNMSRLASLHVWWSPSSSLFAFVDGTAINTWNAATGKHLTSVEYNFQENPTRSEVFDLSWSPDSKLIATVNSLGELYLWDPVTGYISFKYQTPSNGPATITWSHNGLYAFVDMMDVPVIDIFSLVLQGSIQYVLPT